MADQNFFLTTPSDLLPVMESFCTIQGEGLHGGKAAYFIRLGGCDVGCPWCDVKESWDADAHSSVSVDKIVEEACKYTPRLAVITGGEPLMYNLDGLCHSLQKNGFQTHLETSGAYPLTGKWDWICFSPKKFKKPLPEVCKAANELKVIVFNKSDFKWAETWTKEVSKDCELFLQPEWDKSTEMMPLIVTFVKNNPRWRVSLQTHKFLGIP